MLVLPDHGRELERPGGTGFIHHSDFYTGQGADEGCRRVWMLAVGPGVPAGRRSDRPVADYGRGRQRAGVSRIARLAGRGAVGFGNRLTLRR